ncbi:putative methyl-accepting chemotaxis receptor/sensory transducer [Rhodovulum sp. PH10]|nr:putative methyl-accepting chemotaxis receptor/sensory transducer [Rhodovulum sp. PH10]
MRAIYADRAIGTKIMLGFACVLVIMAAIAAASYHSLGTIDDGFSHFVQSVDEATLVRKVDRGFADVRRMTNEYTLATVEQDSDPVVERQRQLRKTIGEVISALETPARVATLQRIAGAYDEYSASFESIVPLKHEQSEIRRTVLGPVGGRVTKQLGTLLELADARPSESGASALAGKVMRSFLLIRLNVSKAFGRIETEAEKRADQDYANLQAALTALGRDTDPQIVRIVDDIRKDAAAYFDGFKKYMALDDRIGTQVDVEMPRRAEAIAKDTTEIRDAAAAEQGVIQDATSDTISGTMSFVGIAGIACVLAGVLLSWLIGRSISRPIVRIGEVLVKIAGGDKEVHIPYVTRRDEVGDNARAAQTFKDNLMRLAAMEADQRAADERAAKERQAAVHRIADSFEAAVGEIIETVSAAATELESAAGSLTKTAEGTQRLSSTVAEASEEASTNVQNVASATNEMTSSVNEISRQVQESTRIAGEAVKQAERTDGRIAELSQAASRIGDVVQLITAIAEQTNLLALNATIEAARAGEAGKGFAVVAQEVKALAAQTAKATGEIATQISGMQAATQDSVGAIKEIGGTIGRISEIAAAIAAAVEQQGAATSEVARNIQHASQGTARVAESIGEVSRGANATEAASEQVRSSAGMLAVEGNKLKDEVARFLMNVRTGPMDRREADDPNYAGPERRADRLVKTPAAVRASRAAA